MKYYLFTMEIKIFIINNIRFLSFIILILLNIYFHLNLNNLDLLLDNYWLTINPFDNFGGNPQNFFSGGGNGSGFMQGPGQGPQGGPNHGLGPGYNPNNVGDDNSRNPDSSTSRPTWADSFIQQSESYLRTPGYNPGGSIPPRSRGDVYWLIRYKLERRLQSSGSHRSGMLALFGYDNPVNNIALSILFGHIVDHRETLSKAYEILDVENGNRKWSQVQISLTSPIMKSLESMVLPYSLT